MFGFSRKKKAQEAQDPHPAPKVNAYQEGAGGPDAAMKLNAIQIVAAASGLSAYNDGRRVWLHAADTELDFLDAPGITLRIEVEDLGDGDFQYSAVCDWYGLLNQADQDLPSRRYARADNIRTQSTFPRAFVFQDGQGDLRLRGEVIVPWFGGHTVAQLRDYLQKAARSAQDFAHGVAEIWPEVGFKQPDVFPGQNGQGALMEGDDRGLEAAEKITEQFVVPGNPFGFIAADTTPVTPERIQEYFVNKQGEHHEIQASGAMYFDVNVEGRDISTGIAVRNEQVFVSCMVRIKPMPGENMAVLMHALNSWSTNRAGIRMGLQFPEEDSWEVGAAWPVNVGAGLSDEQLEQLVPYMIFIITDSFNALLSEFSS